MLRWHKAEHKEDGMIHQPADSIQWRNIDSRDQEFTNDPRNIRLAISTYGMNSFMNNNKHNTWPIVKLPPWLCEIEIYYVIRLNSRAQSTWEQHQHLFDIFDGISKDPMVRWHGGLG